MPDTSSSPHTSAPAPRLRGDLGAVAIVLMVVAAAAPLTTLGASLPLMITLGESVAAPVGFLVAGVVFVLFAAGFVAMTPHVRKPGAFYAYVERGLGTPAGIGAAFVAYLGYTATLIAVYGFIGVVVSNLIASYGGPTIPWWVSAALIVAVVGILGYRSIKLSARVLGVFLIGEIAIVTILDVVIFAQGGSDGISGAPFTGEGIGGGLGIAILFALFGFVGVEATAVFRDEVKDPERTIARATYWSVGIIAVFYALSSVAVIEGNGGLGAVAIATADPDNFVVNTAAAFLGTFGGHVTQVFLVFSLLAAALAFHNISARYQYVLAREGMLPRALGTAHPTHNAPSMSSLLVTVTSVIVLGVFTLLGLDPLLQIYGPMGGVGITGLASLWLLTSISVLVYFGRNRNDRHVRGAGFTIAVAALAIVALAASLILILINMPLIVGGTTTLAVLLVLIAPIFFIVGFVLAKARPVTSLASIDEPEELGNPLTEERTSRAES